MTTMIERFTEATTLDGAIPVIDNLQTRQLLNALSAEAQTLRGSVTRSLLDYFANLEGASVTDLYNLVLSEVEAPLLETVMHYVNGNQSKASEMLGLNRGTLRKKLKQYDLL